MSRSAEVGSIDAIDRLRVALLQFTSRSTDAVETLERQLRRASEWLEHNRPEHWRQQFRDAQDGVHQAKLDLERCLMFSVAGEKPACREEKSVLKQWQQREAYCQQKLELVKQYKRQLHHESLEFSGRTGHLKQLLETEMPKAEAMLRQVLRRLEEYQIEQAPTASPQHPAPNTESDQ